jgi:hypothetical protein
MAQYSVHTRRIELYISAKLQQVNVRDYCKRSQGNVMNACKSIYSLVWLSRYTTENSCDMMDYCACLIFQRKKEAPWIPNLYTIDPLTPLTWNNICITYFFNSLM